MDISIVLPGSGWKLKGVFFVWQDKRKSMRMAGICMLYDLLRAFIHFVDILKIIMSHRLKCFNTFKMIKFNIKTLMTIKFYGQFSASRKLGVPDVPTLLGPKVNPVIGTKS